MAGDGVRAIRFDRSARRSAATCTRPTAERMLRSCTAELPVELCHVRLRLPDRACSFPGMTRWWVGWCAMGLGWCAHASDLRNEWNFEEELRGWRVPPVGGSVVAEPRHLTNRVLQIVASEPHHTVAVLERSDRASDFVVSARVRLVSFGGEPPTIYLYGRRGKDGFCALSLRPTGTALLRYCGPDQPAAEFPGPRLSPMSWVRVKLACVGPRMLGKVWRDGRPEPGWQMEGTLDEPLAGHVALGVWTSPRRPSTATVWFDDVVFQPLTSEDLAAWRTETAARQSLDLSHLSLGDGSFETATHVGLASGDLIVAWESASGRLTHLVHRPSGAEFVASNSVVPCFRIGLARPPGQAKEIIAADEFSDVRVERPDRNQLHMVFTGHPSVPLAVRVMARAAPDGQVHLRIAVTNETTHRAVARIEFPCFAAPAALGRTGHDDRLLLPLSHTDGAVIEAPGAYTQFRDALYPGDACTQFAAFYDETAGLYLAAHDAGGHCKRLGVRSVAGTSVEIPFVHLFPEIVGANVSLPYDVVLGSFTGDWRDAAAVYKRWATNQFWCARRLTERDDVPQFLKRGAAVLIANIQNENGYTGALGERLERLPALCEQYRRRAGVKHVVFVPYGWENRGTWAGIHYLPAVPSSEAWRAVAEALHAQGDRVGMLVSGFWWVVKRRSTPNGPSFDDTEEFERRKDMLIRKTDGSIFTVDFYNRTQEFGSWRGLSVKLCHGSAEARATMLKIFLDVASLGTSLVSFDQEIGGGQLEPCYSATHGHPPGFGNWMWTDFRDLCAEILRQGRSVQPEFALLVENTNELLIPWMATFWSRQFGEVEHGAMGARGVGLFSYLYHEYVTAIGAACVQGQGRRSTRPSAELRCYVLANNLVRGLIPGPFMNDVPLEPANDPWKSKVSRAFFAFCKPYAHFPEYLLLGESCRPPVLECAEQEVWFWRTERERATVRLPTVNVGSFRAPDGARATIVVNTTDRPQRAAVHLKGPAVVYRADRTVEQRWDGSSPGLELMLEPFEVRVVVER